MKVKKLTEGAHVSPPPYLDPQMKNFLIEGMRKAWSSQYHEPWPWKASEMNSFKFIDW